jgi:hypothetical protein
VGSQRNYCTLFASFILDKEWSYAAAVYFGYHSAASALVHTVVYC